MIVEVPEWGFERRFASEGNQAKVKPGVVYPIQKLEKQSGSFRLFAQIDDSVDGLDGVFNISDNALGRRTRETLDRVSAGNTKAWFVLENGALLVMSGVFGAMAAHVRKAKQKARDDVS